MRFVRPLAVSTKLLLSVLAGSLAACSLLVDTNQLLGGASDLPPASSDSRDASADVEPLVDGALVDGSTADGGATCVDGVNRFCTNFDEAAPEARWSLNEKQNADLSFNAQGLSAPNAMLARVTASGGYANAIKIFAAEFAHLRCELDMKLDAVQTSVGTEVDVFDVVTVSSNIPDHVVYLGSFSGVWKLSEFFNRTSNPVDRGVAAPDMPVGTWFHMVIDVTPSTATVTVAGVPTTLSELSTPSGAVRRDLRLGIPYSSKTATGSGVFVDNVDCTTSAQ